mmetsp:Transcript_46817/g.102301  ORF Transcript_46817/g.102301 Transcript_46817/m.102301 type:complete len:92 (+) Transcript_46817:57-332(+)
MVALRSLFFVVAAALFATGLQGCGGDCSEKGCKYSSTNSTDVRKQAIDDYVQCTKDKDCCAPVDIADQMAEHANQLDHSKQDVENMVKCKR